MCFFTLKVPKRLSEYARQETDIFACSATDSLQNPSWNSYRVKLIDQSNMQKF